VHVVSHVNGRLGSSNRGSPVSQARLSQDDRDESVLSKERRFGENGVRFEEG
jgi:hypothetical protein